MKKMWEVIKESRYKKNISSEEQFSKLKELFLSLDQLNVVEIANSFFNTQIELGEMEEFKNLHEMNGSIVSGGDDTFFEDFACWLIAQGEDLFNQFLKDGHSVVLNYIKENKIPDHEYTFENMKYSLPKYLFYDYEKRTYRITIQGENKYGN